jgi:hypothetical protein
MNWAALTPGEKSKALLNMSIRRQKTSTHKARTASRPMHRIPPGKKKKKENKVKNPGPNHFLSGQTKRKTDNAPAKTAP